MSDKVEHACESCGKVRLVNKFKLQENKCLICRACNAKLNAKKRGQAIRESNKNGARTFKLCKQCGNEFFPANNDEQFCSDRCKVKAALSDKPLQDKISQFLSAKRI